jgi:hypothetical protein
MENLTGKGPCQLNKALFNKVKKKTRKEGKKTG